MFSSVYKVRPHNDEGLRDISDLGVVHPPGLWRCIDEASQPRLDCSSLCEEVNSGFAGVCCGKMKSEK